MPISEQTLKEILENNEKAKEQAKKYRKKRFAFKEIFSNTRTFIGIAGLRGIGKTILLKQRLAESEKSFYVSLDAYDNIDLFELAKKLCTDFGATELLLDEINYCKNWQQALKKIYDSLEAKVFFTSSVSIEIINSKIDLSRRIIVKKMHPFSFREFILFKQNKEKEKISILDINSAEKMQKIARLDFLFEEYVLGGLMPAFLEEKNQSIFSNILERIIERDLVYTLNFDGKDILNVKTMLEFIANSKMDDVSYSSISKNIGVTKYKVMQYVEAMEKAFVLNVVKPKGSNVLKEPKILFSPPFRQHYQKNKDFKENIGVLREEFFVESMKIAGIEVFYLKGERGEKTADYTALIENQKFVFEIGGQKKNRTQIIKTKEKNKFILTQPPNTQNPYRPLIFTGFL